MAPIASPERALGRLVLVAVALVASAALDRHLRRPLVLPDDDPVAAIRLVLARSSPAVRREVPVDRHGAACDAGDPAACAALARAYQDVARGVLANLPSCLEFPLFQRACDRGEAAACVEVAAYYRGGRCAERSAIQAETMLLQACRQGDGYACSAAGFGVTDGAG